MRRKTSRTYRIWMGLAHRRHYAAGPVCERWKTSYENFLADMGECPSRNYSIDRIDNAKGYAPSNCRWATMKEQQNNRTNNRRITHGGENLTLMQWSERTGIPHNTIARRLDRLGWPVEEALTRKPDYAPRVRRAAHNAERFKFNGQQMTLREISALCGVPYDTLRQRIRRYGYSLAEAVNAP